MKEVAKEVSHSTPRLGRGLNYNAKFNLWLDTCQTRPHPVSLYIFKAPNGVWFQRLSFLRESGSSETVPDSSAPFFCGNPVPAKHCPIPAPQFFAGIRFQRNTARFQRPILLLECFSSETIHIAGLMPGAGGLEPIAEL